MSNEVTEKKKISAFEYAIMQVADPEEAEKHEPYTKDEEEQMRIDKLMSHAKKMKIQQP